jgi:hypothetical protein
MKILDLINEAETDKAKNARHTKDLDDLERDIRKSGSMDKDTEDAINRKRKQLAKQRMSETATAGATSSGNIASVANPPSAKYKTKKRGKYGAPEAPQKKNPDGTAKNALDVDNNLMGGKPIKR